MIPDFAQDKEDDGWMTNNDRLAWSEDRIRTASTYLKTKLGPPKPTTLHQAFGSVI